jgi:hypothetical protein
MMKPEISPEPVAAVSGEDSGPAGFSAGPPAVKRVRSEVFGKLPDRGMDDGAKGPEIYPALQLSASGHVVERCGACLMAKERCAC